MRFVDQVVIEVEAGRGGPGCIAFRREAYVPNGGPNGGDGGRGGNVIFVADSNLSTLLDFRYRRKYKAAKGRPGEGNNRTGAGGDPSYVRVPTGTLVYDDDTEELLTDLVEENQEFVAALGGMGGRGNYRFRSSTHQAPRRADTGQDGEARRLRLELKLLADVGLVGFPNAGKSTLLSRVTSARPKIADYPFTTLVPNLGIVDLGDFTSCTMADIPGLIEGASEGKGLGHSFLRHVERTRVLVFLLDVLDDPEEKYRALVREIEAYAADLAKAPRIICLNKMDAWPVDEPVPTIDGHEVMQLSAVTGSGVDQLKYRLKDILRSTPVP